MGNNRGLIRKYKNIYLRSKIDVQDKKEVYIYVDYFSGISVIYSTT